MSMRDDIKKRLHCSHLGMESCLRRARECVYWPQMNAEIKDYIGTCETCQAHGNRQQKETLMPHPTPDRPWERVGIGLMELQGKHFLIVVGYFSGFWEIDQLQSTTATAVIRKLKAHFARYGIPDVVISDNGPQFACVDFAAERQFRHCTSSPEHPQANRMAESAVKTAKSLLKKALESNGDPYLAILDHRNTPRQQMGASPAQLLMARRTKTTLPTTKALLKPKVVDCEQQRAAKVTRTKRYYNKHAKVLSPLQRGDTVSVQPFKEKGKWCRGTVTKRLDARSYEVEVEGNQLTGTDCTLDMSQLQRWRNITANALSIRMQYGSSEPFGEGHNHTA
uniref:RNA-directed DNA polymerase n=1 Tax=Rhipicephalus appendiculatus TaxID=34631 RepID=A0A131YWL2_RHIAP